MTTRAVIGQHQRLTFKANLKSSRYGWLRLTPAYGVHLVDELLANEADDVRVLDPYCGTGTTALVCAERGLRSATTDINPFLVWLARAKTAQYTPETIEAVRDESRAVELAIRGASTAEWIPPLHQIEKWWDETSLHALGRAKAEIEASRERLDDDAIDLLLAAFCRTTIERAAVSFGHQSMSFKKRKEDEAQLAPDLLIELAVSSWLNAIHDITSSASSTVLQAPEIELCDARQLSDSLEAEAFDVVVTSPPYPNRMSYIRELRPYMFWLGYLEDGRAAGELDWQAIGGTWGCATSNVGKWLAPDGSSIPFGGFTEILDSIAERSDLLSRYVHKYFVDTVEHIGSLKGVLAPGAVAHYIVGNSKFYDTLLPVEEIYAAIFRAQGFEDVSVTTLRKRSSKRELFEYRVSASRP